MIFSSITFSKAGLVEQPKPDALNGVAGLEPARWVISWLDAFGADQFDLEPLQEDWGYAVRVRVGADVFLLGFNRAIEGAEGDRWLIIIGDSLNRGLFSWTRNRKAAVLARLSEFLESSIRAAEGVSDVVVVYEG